ncbi:MAG: YjbH domain-containing protein [Porticoccaceae bacterium]|nr:YjbH domain-containing protein [Porticoccaceae bacterium]
MYRIVLLGVFGAQSLHASASDFGVTGLIDTPTARMSADGMLTTTAAIQSRTNSYAVTYQATPWLEGTFRYTGWNQADYSYDRNYEAKLRLWQEQAYLPQVAVGIRDLVGTGLWGSEYLVASKSVGDVDLTLGMGWGRLAGQGDFNNPLTQLSNSFDDRGGFEGLGGELSTDMFFSGTDVGLFGGVQYQSGSLPLSVMLEYNPDQYVWERSLGGFKPKSPWSAAVKWEALPGVSLSLSRQHEREWGIELSAALDTKSITPRRPAPKFRSSLDMAPQDLPPQINPRDWYDTLLFDVERSGLLLLEASIEPSSQTAILVMGNDQYPVWADAVAKMTVLADLHLPSSVKTFRIVAEEAGHRVQTLQMRRPSMGYGQSKELLERQISVLPGRNLASPQRKTRFEEKKVFFDVGLSNRLQLFDPDDPARYQLYAKAGVSLALPKSWTLTGAYGFDITNNFNESTRDSDSVLPRVRSDVVKYLTEGETGLDSLYFEKRGSGYKQLHYRVFGGVLEEMYSGLGGEVLYQPFQSRLAYGLSANWLQQRAFDKSFRRLDYQTTTAFASVYWASPFYNFDVAMHAGKYLAKDVGATLEVRRTFANGWMVGLWATKTDVSSEDFGEGSFDKGMFFKIPFDRLFGRDTRSGYSARIRPIQRDGGQRLEDFSGNIWWDIRGARYDAFSDYTDRMVP